MLFQLLLLLLCRLSLLWLSAWRMHLSLAACAKTSITHTSQDTHTLHRVLPVRRWTSCLCAAVQLLLFSPPAPPPLDSRLFAVDAAHDLGVQSKDGQLTPG